MIVKCRKKPGRHLRQLRHERRCRLLCSQMLQPPERLFWRNPGLERSPEPSAAANSSKKANNQEPPGDICDSCDKRLDVSDLF